MGPTANPTRQNRTLTGDVHDESTYLQVLRDGQAFVECVLACILSIGFPLTHQATGTGGGGLTRHSHDARVRLGDLTVGRIQCPACKAVLTVLPHCVYASAACALSAPGRPCWPPTAASAWHGRPPSALSPRWPAIASSVSWGYTAGSRCG